MIWLAGRVENDAANLDPGMRIRVILITSELLRKLQCGIAVQCTLVQFTC